MSYDYALQMKEIQINNTPMNL